MKRICLALALAILGLGTAGAQSDLTNGVFIAHYPPGLLYTDIVPDWCATYAESPITGCEQQNNRIDTNLGVVWYVLAAWDGDRNWCGTEFGLGAYDVGIAIFETGPCPPSALTIPYGGWPGPNSGISIAAAGTPWQGNFQPVVWFASYAYYSGVVSLTPHPGTAFGGFANCLTPPESYPAVCFGGMGMFEPGVYCCPPAPTPAVCCVGTQCFLLFEDECAIQGGVFHPEWTSCEPSPCDGMPAVCCIGHICVLVMEDDCIAAGGHWLPELHECDPDPCGAYTPAGSSSWGEIKAIYR